MKWKPLACAGGLCALLIAPAASQIHSANLTAHYAVTGETHSGSYIETFADSPNRAHHVSQNIVWDVAQRSLQLAQREPAQQAEPAAVADAAGNLIVVWTDTRLGQADIYAQKLDAAGHALWPSDVRVSGDAGGHAHRHPAIAIDALGQTVIAWVAASDAETRAVCCDVFAQKLDAAGNKQWLAAVRVNQNPHTALDAPPTLAVLPNGSIAAGWADARSPLVNIYLQRLSAEGAVLALDDALFAPAALEPAAQRSPILRAAGTHLVLAWADCAPPDLCHAHAQRLNDAFAPQWSSAVQLSAITHTLMMSATRPLDVAIDPADQSLIAAWTDLRDGDADVYAQRVGADGRRVWPNDVRLNSDLGSSGQSGVAVDVSALGSVFAWRDERQLSPSLFAQKLNSQGDKQWVVDTRVSDTAAVLPADAVPVLRVTGTGARVAWADARLGQPAILSQGLTITGARTTLTNTQVPLAEARLYAAGVITSPVINTATNASTLTGTLPVRSARLVADLVPNGGEVTFYLSNGHGWLTATPGIALVFPMTGTELAWKATMQASPYQTRSPRVTRLQIDYTSQAVDAEDEADAYEADDTCAAATLAQINGAAQTHTFHRNGDVDWLRFEVVTGTTYVVQTSRAQSNADTQLALLTDCAKPSVASNQNVLGNDARIVWRAPARGTVWAHISNNPPNLFGYGTHYDVSVRAQSIAPITTSIATSTVLTTTPLVIIVTGRNNISDALQANFSGVGDQTYRAFIATGTPKNRIRYLGHAVGQDIDGNGLADDIYATPTVTRVREAIQTWARQMGVGPGVPVYLVVAQHGGPDELILDVNQRVQAGELNLWLSNLEAATDLDQLTVVIEGSQSGSFIDASSVNTASLPAGSPATLSARNRVIIASTGAEMNAYPSIARVQTAGVQTAGAHFSDMLWSGLAHSQDVLLAFATAQDALLQHGLTQVPALDDNGDAVADAEDGTQARARGIGPRFSGDVPVIDFVSVEEVTNNSTTVRTQVKDDFAVQRVWAEVYPPNFAEPPLIAGVMPTLTLTRPVFSATGNDLFVAPLTGLDQAGCYRVVVNAQDLEGHFALPQVALVCNLFTVYMPLVRR